MPDPGSRSQAGERPDLREPRGIADRGFRNVVRNESTAFGFSVMITLTFGALQITHGTPRVAHLFLFAAGATLVFAGLEMLLSRGFRESLPEHDSNVAALGTALNFLSVFASLAAAVGLAEIIGSAAAWLVCPLGAALVYIVAEALEIMLAERVQRARGNVDANEVTD